MKLEKLGLNLSLMNQTEQRVFFHRYIEKRTIDLAEPVVIKKPRKSGSTRGKNVAVTAETLDILKKLRLI